MLLKKPLRDYTVETDIGKRWEQGVDHNPRSIELYEALADIDWCFLDDHHCFKSGGDGDNGEALMYLMDIYFDQQAADLLTQEA